VKATTAMVAGLLLTSCGGPASSPASIQAWFKTHGSVADPAMAVPRDFGDAAGPITHSFCQRVTDATKKAGALPSIPDTLLEGYWRSYLDRLAVVAHDCEMDVGRTAGTSLQAALHAAIYALTRLAQALPAELHRLSSG
jgi:hypothetical protein